MKIKRYQSKFDYSYTLGLAPTVELLLHQLKHAVKVIVSSDYSASPDGFSIFLLCERLGVPCEFDDNAINRIATKGNVYVIGIFNKYKQTLAQDRPHLLLVQPSDTGNLGTILRTGLGFDFVDVAIVVPAVDYFHPSTLRSSMGAVFSSRIALFGSVEEYEESHPNHALFLFMLDGAHRLENAPAPKNAAFTLVFGNEATGLPPSFLAKGESVFIEHSSQIDSLNLAVAAGIALRHFYQKGSVEKLKDFREN